MAEDNFAPYKKYIQTGRREDLTKYARQQIEKSNRQKGEILPHPEMIQDVDMVEQDQEMPYNQRISNDLNAQPQIHVDDSNDVLDSSDDDSDDGNNVNLQREFEYSEEDHVPLFTKLNNNNYDDSPECNLPEEIFEDAEDSIIDDSNEPHSLKNLMNSAEYNEKISTPVAVTPLEILFMVLKFSIVHKLPLSTLSNLVTLINYIFAKRILPQSRYMINQYFNELNNTEFHITCSKCRRYVGKLNEIPDVYQCTRCFHEGNVADPGVNNCIAIIDPSKAISQLLETHENYYYDVLHEERSPDSISDIYDGKKYKEFKNSLPNEYQYRYVTAVMNTDGAEPFQKSPRSLWPLFLMINEIPPQDRFDNIIPCALWFNRKKPRMSVFLKLFVDLVKSIGESGIECCIKGDKISVKLFPLVCCVDTIARAPMQGIMQFNGKYGCNWCEHPTEYFAGATRYPLLQEVNVERSKEKTEEIMRNLPEKLTKRMIKQNKGIKKKSALIDLPYFNIISGFVPDYMHALVAGVVKQISRYLAEEKDRPEYARLLEEIKLPNQVCRFTRSIEDNKYWKAREWENWILYVSIILFKSKLKEKYISYWSLLVESTYLLLQSKITYPDLNRANGLLHEFVIKTEKYFGLSAMTFNVHQLLHMTDSVVNWVHFGHTLPSALKQEITSCCNLLNVVME